MKKIFMNGFAFLKKVYEKQLDLKIDFFFPKSRSFDMITNFLAFRKMCRKGEIDKYAVVHINNWENFLNVKYKRKKQFWIAESHGIHLGLNNKIAISQSKGIKKILSFIFSGLISHFIRKSIKKFDVYIVSIPNALEFAKKIRKDAVWIPNPVNNIFFQERKVKRLEGNPAVFMPSRLHPVKNPEFAFKLFRKILLNYPDAKLHLIKYNSRFGNEKRYKNYLDEFSKNIIFHEHIKMKELSSYYKGADLVLGAFSKQNFYSNLNLIELEAMASGAPVVARDTYEIIKKDFDELEKMTFRIIKDKKFRKQYIKKTRDYVKRVHCEKNVAKIYKKIIKK